MSPREVKLKWPKEYSLIFEGIKEADCSTGGIGIAKNKTDLNLEEFIRIVLSIQCGMSLEELYVTNVPFIKKDIEEIELEWNKFDNA